MVHSCRTCKYNGSSEFEYPCSDCYSLDEGYPQRWTPRPVEPKKEQSSVDHPTHYNQGGIECIDAMVAAFGKEAVENFCLINAFKYVWRNLDKNGLEDIDKAIWYLNKFKELNSSE